MEAGSSADRPEPSMGMGVGARSGRVLGPEELEATAQLRPLPLSQEENQITSKHRSRKPLL